ncbi:MAG: DUF1844 domain-containing protein [Planctomycetota bacterium]
MSQDKISFGPNFMSDDIPIFQNRDEKYKEDLKSETLKADSKVKANKEEKKKNNTDQNFLQIVSLVASQAYILLGAMENPATGTPTPNLAQARAMVDSLSALYKKTEGNLSEEEDRMMRQLLSELQMLYVEASRGPAPHPQPGPTAKGPGTP